MHQLSNLLDNIQNLFDHGGWVLQAIMLISILMWALIIERYWYIKITYPERMKQLVKQWQKRNDHTSWYAKRMREGIIGDVAIELQKNILPIQALVSILPLLGLLGTVTGMIATFEVMTIFGTGNTKGMASGISEALITTTAGLVTSLSGLYFSAQLQTRAKLETQKTADHLI